MNFVHFMLLTNLNEFSPRFPSFGFGNPLHLIQLPTPSGLRPPSSGCHLLTAHGAGSWTTPFTGFPSGRRSKHQPSQS